MIDAFYLSALQEVFHIQRPLSDLVNVDLNVEIECVPTPQTQTRTVLVRIPRVETDPVCSRNRPDGKAWHEASWRSENDVAEWASIWLVAHASEVRAGLQELRAHRLDMLLQQFLSYISSCLPFSLAFLIEELDFSAHYCS